MSLYPIAIEYNEAGLRLIPLYASQGKKCSCDDPDCAIPGKHPMRTGWQNQQIVDPQQIYDAWRDAYGCTGLGWALDQDHIVIDVDPRNGGGESLDQLQIDLKIDLFDICKTIVKTGGNGWHFYFKKDPIVTFGCKMPSKYPGIDIKRKGGYVVIPGSNHASGNTYEWKSAIKSDLEDMAQLPDSIAEMLRRVQVIYTDAAKAAGATDANEIADMVSLMDADMGYDDWVKVGMAIHSATDGSQDGLITWDSWSKKGSKYKDGICSQKWHGFGKYAGSTINIGSLVRMAESCGWTRQVDESALSKDELQAIKDSWSKTSSDRVDIPSISDDADLDIYKPPGILGDLYRYADSCTPFENNNLSLACALFTLGSIVGHRYYIAGRYGNIRPNIIAFGVAGAGTGKEATLGAAKSIMRSVGLHAAMHLEIKSEKELSDTMEMNQYSMYLYDEFGEFLKKVSNAGKSGASYLEGVPGRLMQAFTAANGDLGMNSDRANNLKNKWNKEHNFLKKIIKDDNGSGVENAQKKLDRVKFLSGIFEFGIPNPFISMFTMSTPGSMRTAFTISAVESGLLSRAMVFEESETNPLPKPDFTGSPSVPMGLSMRLKSIAMHRDDCPYGRVDSYQQVRQELKVDPLASALISRAASYFYELAEVNKENSLESLARRGVDYTIKICIAMASDGGVVTLEIARYAIKLVKHEMAGRMRKVIATENMDSHDQTDRAKGLTSRVIELCNGNGESMNVLINRCQTKLLSKEFITKVVTQMEKAGQLVKHEAGRVPKYKSNHLAH